MAETEASDCELTEAPEPCDYVRYVPVVRIDDHTFIDPSDVVAITTNMELSDSAPVVYAQNFCNVILRSQGTRILVAMSASALYDVLKSS